MELCQSCFQFFDLLWQPGEFLLLAERELAFAGRLGGACRRFGPGSRTRGGCLGQFSLPQPVVVSADILFHAEGGRLRGRRFEHKRAGDDVVEEGPVVADHQHGAGVIDEPFFEQFECFRVEIVGRFVEHDHVGRLGKEPGQQHPIPLATGEKFHQRAGPLGAKQKILQIADDMPGLTADLHGFIAVGNIIGHRFLIVELFAELIEIGDLQIRSQPHGAAGGSQLAQQDPQQRCFAGAVGADDADPIAPHHGGGDAIEDAPLLPLKNHLIERGHEGP